VGFQLGVGVPGGLAVALLLAAIFVALVVGGLWDLRRERSRRRRLLLGGLRVATALLLWAVAVQPRWTGERVRREPGRLAVLVDGSRSMSVRAGERSRAERAVALLERWSRGEEVPASFHVFDADVRSASLQDLIADYPTEGEESRLVPAVAGVAGREGRTDVGAVVIVSDGAATGGPPPLGQLPAGVRVHAVAVGDDEELHDDAIVRVAADRVGFLRQVSQVRAEVRSTGGGPRTIPVTLRRGDQVVRETTVELDARGEGEVDIPFTSERLGRAVYRLSIPIDPGDAVPENNERAFLVRVVRDRLRVLLVAGRPSWDVRFLREFLKRDPAIDLVSFFILRTASDLTMASPDELALIPFPTDELFREHLGSFDVVLFQNFDYAPYGMAPYLSRVRDYVWRGGSFAMVGGDLAFASGGYAGTPIEEILPVALPPGAGGRGTSMVPGSFLPVPEPERVRHPLLELLPDPAANAAAWSALAPLAGANLFTGMRSEGHRLLAHPKHRVGGAGMPVLAVGTAGEGRSMAFGTDASWRWGMTTAGTTGDGSAYDRFWDRALRWLARDPSLEPCQLDTDRELYGPGARVRAEAWVRDANYEPESARRVHFEVRDMAGEVTGDAMALTDGEGRARAEVRAPVRPGGYRVTVRRDDESEARCEEWLVVESGGEELADPRARADWLRAMVEATDGTFHPRPEDAPNLDAFDATTTRSLGTVTVAPMASPWAFVLIVLLLGAEWAVRRRWGYR
jgi:uncharacterized membrane protein